MKRCFYNYTKDLFMRFLTFSSVRLPVTSWKQKIKLDQANLSTIKRG